MRSLLTSGYTNMVSEKTAPFFPLLFCFLSSERKKIAYLLEQSSQKER